MEPRNTWREPRNTWRALQTAGLERIPISPAEHSKAKWGVENLLSTSRAPAAPGLQLEFPDWPQLTQLTPEDQRPLAVHSW